MPLPATITVDALQGHPLIVPVTVTVAESEEPGLRLGVTDSHGRERTWQCPLNLDVEEDEIK